MTLSHSKEGREVEWGSWLVEYLLSLKGKHNLS